MSKEITKKMIFYLICNFLIYFVQFCPFFSIEETGIFSLSTTMNNNQMYLLPVGKDGETISIKHGGIVYGEKSRAYIAFLTNDKVSKSSMLDYFKTHQDLVWNLINGELAEQPHNLKMSLKVSTGMKLRILLQRKNIIFPELDYPLSKEDEKNLVCLRVKLTHVNSNFRNELRFEMRNLEMYVKYFF